MKLEISSVMLDTSFCIRLMDNKDSLHQNALAYFKYFLQKKISIHLSTIAIAEYAAGDDPSHLPIETLQIEAFDFRDATAAGSLHSYLFGEKTNIEGYNRRIVANDVKILAQAKTRSIASIIAKDVASFSRYVSQLKKAGLLNLMFLDLNTPANEGLGELFLFT